MSRLLLTLTALIPLATGWFFLGPPAGHLAGVAMAQDTPGTRGVQETPKTKGYPKDSGGGPEYDRSKRPDSFRYYGPNGLWKTWSAEQRFGRNTWWFYTAGNQKFYRILGYFGGEHGISIDFYRLLAMSHEDRFRKLGLINEPNFEEGGTDPEYGFRTDLWKGDPYGLYDEKTGQPCDRDGKPIPGAQGNPDGPAYPRNPEWYGEPTGILGLRRFPNPEFKEKERDDWKKDPQKSLRDYFKSPGKVEPPYVFGITCIFCHVAFDPLNPPKDVANPRWENLSANIGNQYLREGDLFFGAGRVVGGDANPGPKYGKGDGDPYDTRGLDEKSFLFQYGHTQQPGTSETSRFSYDFINNPNTINQIINIAHRRDFIETTPTGEPIVTKHILKDGSDSVGIRTALLRVYINIGSEGDYWADHLWNPVAGTSQAPFQLREVQGFVSPARWAELRKKYPQFGDAWAESDRRVDALISYLASYSPFSLKGVKGKGGKPYLSEDEGQLQRGAEVFLQSCARCHSSDQPAGQYPKSMNPDPASHYRASFASPDFRLKNTFSDDVRYPYNFEGLGINAGRAMATNAIEGDIWADLSSRDYKALPPLRDVSFENPLNLLDPTRFGSAPIVTRFVAPGAGRGYYRTAALNSMWATAPYLHNNSIGADPLDPKTGLIDPKSITIEGRLDLFEKAMSELLNPETRRPKIKVTSADCGLIDGLPGARGQVVEMVRDMARRRLREVLAQAIAEAVDEVPLAEVDEPLRPLIKTGLLQLLVVSQPLFDRLATPDNLEKLKAFVATEAQKQIEKTIQEKLQGRPKLQALVTEVKPKFDQVLQKKMAVLSDLVPQDLIIPKGTPINLITNLNVARAPYALKAYLKNKSNERVLVEELLKLSDCPDLVENRGHTFGSELRPADKRALIEFLKTL